MKTVRVPKGSSFRSRLALLDPCNPAFAWVGFKSLATAWATCDRADWMLWLATKLGIARTIMTLAACECAELARCRHGQTEVLRNSLLLATVQWTQSEAPDYVVRTGARSARSLLLKPLDDPDQSALYAAYYAAMSIDDSNYAQRVPPRVERAAGDPKFRGRMADMVRERITCEMIAGAMPLRFLAEPEAAKVEVAP